MREKGEKSQKTNNGSGILDNTTDPVEIKMIKSDVGVPVVVQRKLIQLVSMRMWVQSLALLSGSGIWHHHELWCRLQMRLGSHIAGLWHKPAAGALIPPLAWELLYTASVALKRRKKKKKKEEEEGGGGGRAHAETISLNFPILYREMARARLAQITECHCRDNISGL